MCPQGKSRKKLRKTEPRRPVTAQMPEPLIQRLDKFATELHCSRAQLIIRLLEEALEQIEPARAIYGNMTLKNPQVAAAIEAAMDQADTAMSESLQRQRAVVTRIMETHPEMLAEIFTAMAQSMPQQTDLIEQLASTLDEPPAKGSKARAKVKAGGK
jgi:metal-responsive CopG/Arc/MetJ family transcriptional regulator